MARKHDRIIVTVTDYSDGTQDIEIKEEERCCGSCCWMFGENCDGDGCCAKHYLDKTPNCGDMPCDDFFSYKDMRHHLAVLLQHKRWFHATNGLMPIDFDGIEKAIDFAVDYIKTYSKL